MRFIWFRLYESDLIWFRLYGSDLYGLGSMVQATFMIIKKVFCKYIFKSNYGQGSVLNLNL
jgi:hypothetical protein